MCLLENPMLCSSKIEICELCENSAIVWDLIWTCWCVYLMIYVFNFFLESHIVSALALTTWSESVCIDFCLFYVRSLWLNDCYLFLCSKFVKSWSYNIAIWCRNWTKDFKLNFTLAKFPNFRNSVDLQSQPLSNTVQFLLIPSR